MAAVMRPTTRRAVRRKPDPAEIATAIAARIDREADHLLHLGLHQQAELMAHRAAEMRTGVAR